MWLGSSRTDVRRFPAAVRVHLGFQLWRVQLGHAPNDWKPMHGVGRGVREIRTHVGGEHRVIYTTEYSEAVHVLHAFSKHSRKTARTDVEVARRRLEQLRRRRRERS